MDECRCCTKYFYECGDLAGGGPLTHDTGRSACQIQEITWSGHCGLCPVAGRSTQGEEGAVRDRSSINAPLTNTKTPTSKRRAPAESSTSSGTSPTVDKPPPKKSLREGARPAIQSPSLEVPAFRPGQQPTSWLHANYNIPPLGTRSPSSMPPSRQPQVDDPGYGGYGGGTRPTLPSLANFAQPTYGQPPPAYQPIARVSMPPPYAQAPSAPSLTQTAGPVTHFTQGATPAVSFCFSHDPLADISYGPRGGLTSAGQHRGHRKRGRGNADDIPRRKKRP